MEDIIPALYLVATPLGNLADTTSRANFILSHVDVVACEDTRETKKLFQLLNVERKERIFVSVHEHNEREKADSLLDVIEQGQSCAYVSDAGMPAISDPGAHLVDRAHDRGIRVIPIPGATAVTTAMSVSGFDGEFYFGGFFPRRQKDKDAVLTFIEQARMHTVFYESPQRIVSTLREIDSVIGVRRVVVCREMTKKFEQILRGTPSSILDQLGEAPKGECVFVIEKQRDPESKRDAAALLQSIAAMKCKGLSSRDVIEILEPLELASKNSLKDYYQSAD